MSNTKSEQWRGFLLSVLSIWKSLGRNSSILGGLGGLRANAISVTFSQILPTDHVVSVKMLSYEMQGAQVGHLSMGTSSISTTVAANHRWKMKPCENYPYHALASFLSNFWRMTACYSLTHPVALICTYKTKHVLQRSWLCWEYLLVPFRAINFMICSHLCSKIFGYQTCWSRLVSRNFHKKTISWHVWTKCLCG